MTPTIKNEYAFFNPVGPLKYFLINDIGNAVLGLYKHIYSDRLVLIGNCFGQLTIFAPPFGKIEELMKDQISIRSVLIDSEWTQKSGASLSLIQGLQVRCWIYFQIPSLTMKALKGRHYLNYYYIFANSTFSIENKASNIII